MLNIANLVNIERQAAETLREVLEEVPDLGLVVDDIEKEPQDSGIDFVFRISYRGERRAMACEVKSSGQPRHVQNALFQLRRYAEARTEPVTLVVVAPYLSEDARALCLENGVGYLDFEGNARIAFPGFFFFKEVAGKPPAERRGLRSLFKPKSAQVIRAMLRDPGRAWRVADLSELAGVSAGHVSYVRSGLLDRGWAEVSSDGVFLSNPDALLDVWRDEYKPPVGDRRTFYTTMHGLSLDSALRTMQGEAREGGGSVVLASFSAANWVAPYGRTGTHYFYADLDGVQRLSDALKLSPASRGENVMVTVLDEPGPLRDFIEPAPGIRTTSPVQTYLDLYASGERGREAAEHLREEALQWKK